MHEAGEQIGDWAVVGLLGAGGMGTVYHCKNRMIGTITAAVKILKVDGGRFLNTTSVHQFVLYTSGVARHGQSGRRDVFLISICRDGRAGVECRVYLLGAKGT
jgi:hypothetical protein